ncbi:amidase [Streptomyces sp. NPDC004647]|uniref:amidase n=1 Tax=Streptomyces sp. NPDC004647 TaxID=3154671 RepID=UPI0033AB8DE9
MQSPGSQSAIELASAIRTGALSARAVAEEVVQSLSSASTGSFNSSPSINAFALHTPEQARAAARRIDKAVAAGRDPGPLAGVPFAVKDLQALAGAPTGFGSLACADAGPERDSSVWVARLLAAGAVPVGKTTTAEFGLDSITATPANGVTRSPWDAARSPGGSSGGSAAVVAAGLVPFATATDSGGSLRTPASLCGLVGLLPAQALLPGEDGDSLNAAFPLVREVADAALLLDVLAEGACQPVLARLDEPLPAGVRIAWSPDLGYARCGRAVTDVVYEAYRVLVEDAALDEVDLAVGLPNPYPVFLVTHLAFLKEHLARRGVWPRKSRALAPLTRMALEAADGFTAADLAGARQERAGIADALRSVFEQVDVLATPMAVGEAWPADGPAPTEVDGVDISHVGSEPFALPANLAGLPAVSVPAGEGPNGLPVGIQLIGRPGGEGLLLRLARRLERARPWRHRYPFAAGATR